MRANIRFLTDGPATPERPLPRIRSTIRPKGRTWGERLRFLRESVGLTQDRLAAGAGLRAMTVSELERGQSSATETTVVALASALGVTQQQLRAFCERGAAIPSSAGADAVRRRTRMEFRAIDDSFAPWIRRGDRLTVDPSLAVGPDHTPAVVLSADAEGDIVPVLALVMKTPGGVRAALAIGADSRAIDAREVFPVVRIDREAAK